MIITKLPLEIVEIIFNFCKTVENKDLFIRILFPQYFYMLKDDKTKWIKRHFNSDIIELLGGINKAINYPILSLNKNLKLKFTRKCIIENIKLSDLDNNNIVIGIDSTKRGFISFRNKKNNVEFVDTIFQAFTSNKYLWSNGSCVGEFLDKNGFFVQNGQRKQLIYSTLKNIIQSF